jgi:serine beta-lactamase-like protein LACTB, mitochondrial
MKSFSYSRAKVFIVIVTILGTTIPGIGSQSVARSAPFYPDPVSSKQYNQAIQQSRKNALGLISRQNIPGFSIAVAIGGRIIWSEGFGFADLENRVEVRPSTRFRIGSLSKLLTVSAVAQLYEQGRLDLDAPVQRYVPTFPKKDQDITARQLAGHLAGIKQYARDEYINLQRYATVVDSLKIFQDSPLLHTPGSKYSYSSYGYNLLAAVVEGASGQNFLTYMQEKVLGPLKMESTEADENTRVISHRTRFYSVDSKGQLMNAPYTDNSDRWGAGGFLSTAEDLARFASAYLKDGFLKAETRALLFTSQKTADGKETNVGLGWRIGKDSKGQRILHHGGESIGGRAFLLMYPEKEVVVVMLANLTFAKFGEQEAAQVAELFMDK